MFRNEEATNQQVFNHLMEELLAWSMARAKGIKSPSSRELVVRFTWGRRATLGQEAQAA
uniref:Uncharacterized protein n=1 Tax=Oryza barthii TaxID=65489 RepID=A0A679B9T5_9ORYZ|nr:hypothetical protein [Oryza barthii]